MGKIKNRKIKWRKWKKSKSSMSKKRLSWKSVVETILTRKRHKTLVPSKRCLKFARKKLMRKWKSQVAWKFYALKFSPQITWNNSATTCTTSATSKLWATLQLQKKCNQLLFIKTCASKQISCWPSFVLKSPETRLPKFRKSLMRWAWRKSTIARLLKPLMTIWRKLCWSVIT